MFESSAVDHIVTASRLAWMEFAGFTIHAETGKKFNRSGKWVVGGIIPALELTNDMTKAEIYALVTDWYSVAQVLDGGESVVGGWVSNDILYIDLISLVDTETEAILLGKAWKQQAVGYFGADGIFNERELVES